MLFLWFTFLVAFILSLAAKFFADAFLSSRIAILGSFFGLELAHNPGIAFSISIHDAIQTPLITLAFAAILILAIKSAQTTMSQTGFGLILGGALGNIADRLPDGMVTDFVQVGTFPIFNVADSCITIGVILLFGEILLTWWNKRNSL